MNRLAASQLSFFFFKKYVRAQSRRLQAFPHKQPNLSLWFSTCFFCVFLRDDISAGKPNCLERVLSLWGSLQCRVKIGKSFLGNGIKDWWVTPKGPALSKLGQNRRDHSFIPLFVFYSYLSFSQSMWKQQFRSCFRHNRKEPQSSHF